MAESFPLSYCARQVRRHDRDRYLTCLFAPAGRREGLFALYFIGCFVGAIWLRMWPSMPFLYLFVTGYCYMFVLAFSSGRPRTKPLPDSNHG